MGIENIINSTRNFVKENSFSVGVALYSLTSAADAYMTSIGINKFGTITEEELSPLPEFLMENYGVIPGIVIDKTFAVLLVASICQYAKHKYPKIDILLYGASAAQGLVTMAWALQYLT